MDSRFGPGIFGLRPRDSSDGWGLQWASQGADLAGEAGRSLQLLLTGSKRPPLWQTDRTHPTQSGSPKVKGCLPFEEYGPNVSAVGFTVHLSLGICFEVFPGGSRKWMSRFSPTVVFVGNWGISQTNSRLRVNSRHLQSTFPCCGTLKGSNQVGFCATIIVWRHRFGSPTPKSREVEVGRFFYSSAIGAEANACLQFLFGASSSTRLEPD